MSTSPLLGPLIHFGALAPFRDLSHRQHMVLAVASDEVLYEADAWIVQRGTPAAAMLLIVDGYADILSDDDAPISRGPGEVVGFPEILLPGPGSSGVRAQTDVVALRIETDALREACEQNFAILAGILTHIARTIAMDTTVAAQAMAGTHVLPAADDETPLDRVGRILALHRARALPSDSMDALADLAGRIQEQRFATGEKLWTAGQPAEGFWVIASGAVEVTNPGAPPFRLGVGGVPGLIGTFAGSHHVGSAEAVVPVATVHVPVDAFMDVLEDHFELAFSLLGRMAQHLVDQPPVVDQPRVVDQPQVEGQPRVDDQPRVE